jgi:hypothetical protein
LQALFALPSLADMLVPLLCEHMHQVGRSFIESHALTFVELARKCFEVFRSNRLIMLFLITLFAVGQLFIALLGL